MDRMKSKSTSSPKVVYRTRVGGLYCGKSEEVLKNRLLSRYKGKVQLYLRHRLFRSIERRNTAIFQGKRTPNGWRSSHLC